MKIAIDQMVGTISPNIASHKGAWAYMWKNRLSKMYHDATIDVLHKGASWDGYDLICIDHGMEFKGSLNLFGGASDEPALRIGRLLDFDSSKLVSLDIPMPDYGALGKSRLSACTDTWKNIDWNKVSDICSSIPMMNNRESTHLLLGDSHAFSMYKPGMCVSRNDGQTLYGALSKGLKSFLSDDTEKISLYFGNIDIRHHLMRQPNPKESIIKLLNEYFKQIKDLNLDYVELIEVLPIENISRNLPKTGYYKGTPYFGSWLERSELVNIWNAELSKECSVNDWVLHKHPRHIFYNDIGELPFEVMEKPKSVHCSREFYRWDLINDSPNPKYNRISSGMANII